MLSTKYKTQEHTHTKVKFALRWLIKLLLGNVLRLHVCWNNVGEADVVGNFLRKNSDSQVVFANFFMRLLSRQHKTDGLTCQKESSCLERFNVIGSWQQKKISCCSASLPNLSSGYEKIIVNYRKNFTQNCFFQ